MSNVLDQDIKFIPGVGPGRATLLENELNIRTLEDLITYYPFKYVDRTKIYTIKDIKDVSSHIQIKGHITGFKTVGEGAKTRLVAYFTDGKDIVDLIWFKKIKFVTKTLVKNREYIMFGKPSKFHDSYNFVHPELEDVDRKDMLKSGYLQAQYQTTDKMKKANLNSNAIHKIQFNAIQKAVEGVQETTPAWLRKKVGLVHLKEALTNIHFPTNEEALNQAQIRLKFEELFYIQLKLIHLRQDRQNKFNGHKIKGVGDIFNTFFHNNIPFELTGAQKRVLKEIFESMKSGKQMNRLLQGDVGSGKTMVALMAALMVVDNGYQGAIMAPTEILASQHLDSIVEMLHDIDIDVKLLTGSTKKKDREVIHRELEDGTLDIIIGTHAILEDKVKFKNLGLVVIDEQHRFGVMQRSKLWKKNYIPPHILVMTATPIPRTLAMTLYGDLDISVIDELPPGRKPIETRHYFYSKRNKVNSFIRAEIKKGRQAYIVYPLIEESDTLDYQSLYDGYKQMKEDFPNVNISMVHGKMKPQEKEEEMQRFKNHETDIMVATTVIEVGVNVPNASIMVIESSERFGLSQLHQLRGRVGRGAEQSYCILLSSTKLSETGRERIDTMVRTNDGFEIAESDLKLRGPGDLDGTQQSGVAMTLKIANISKDSQILSYSRDLAQKILDSDPELSHPLNDILKRQLAKLQKNYFKWGVIS